MPDIGRFKIDQKFLKIDIEERRAWILDLFFEQSKFLYYMTLKPKTKDIT